MTINQVVDDFYSLAPKYRTKKKLKKMFSNWLTDKIDDGEWITNAMNRKVKKC